MANNTKLVGFTAKGIVLERWGKTVNIEMGTESLRHACYDLLPRQPPAMFGGPGQPNNIGWDRFSGHFEETIDGAELQLGVNTIRYFIRVLEEAKATGDEKAWEYIEHLNAILTAHAEYHDPKGEPGVDEPAEPTVGQEAPVTTGTPTST